MVGPGGRWTGVLSRSRNKRDRRRHPRHLLPVALVTPDQLIPQPHELVLRNGAPDTIAGWKALADGPLTNQSCVFHRNLEISSRCAWIYKFLPAYFKWAGMAAFASHHVRLALFPLRLDRDRTGYFTSFYYYALIRGMRQVRQAQAWSRITRFDDRWRWIVTCIVPRFRRLDIHTRLVDASLRRVFDEARDYASNPCILPRSSHSSPSSSSLAPAPPSGHVHQR